MNFTLFKSILYIVPSGKILSYYPLGKITFNVPSVKVIYIVLSG